MGFSLWVALHERLSETVRMLGENKLGKENDEWSAAAGGQSDHHQLLTVADVFLLIF